jgi:hypothetical protein
MCARPHTARDGSPTIESGRAGAFAAPTERAFMSKLDTWLSPIRMRFAVEPLCALLKAVAGDSTSDHVTYIAVFTLTQGVTAEIESKLRGLLGWHLVYLGSETRLVTYWKSKECFEGAGEILPAASFSAVNEGPTGEIHLPQSRFKRFVGPLPAWQNAVILVAGVLAAFTTIREFKDYLFATPELSMQYEKPAFDFVEGKEMDLNFSIENQISTQNTDLDIAAVLYPGPASNAGPQDRSGMPLAVSETPIPELNPREQKDLSLSARAPAAGTYHAALSVRVKAGFFRLPQTLAASAVQVNVWPRNPAGSIDKLGPYGKHNEFIEIAGSVRVGAANAQGIDCQLQVAGIPGLTLLNYDLPDHVNDQWTPNTTPGSEVVVLSWTLPPATSMQKLAVRLYLKPGSKPDWAALRKATQLSCANRTEELPK